MSDIWKPLLEREEPYAVRFTLSCLRDIEPWRAQQVKDKLEDIAVWLTKNTDSAVTITEDAWKR